MRKMIFIFLSTFFCNNVCQPPEKKGFKSFEMSDFEDDRGSKGALNWYIYIKNPETEEVIRTIHTTSLLHFQSVVNVIEENEEAPVARQRSFLETVCCIPPARSTSNSSLKKIKKPMAFYQELETIKGADGKLEVIRNEKLPHGLLLLLSLKHPPKEKINITFINLGLNRLYEWLLSESEYKEKYDQTPCRLVMIEDYANSNPDEAKPKEE